MTKSKLFLILMIAALLLLSISPLTAQEKKNALEKGAWTLQFGLTDKFYPTTFQGGTFSIKRHLSDKKALRLDLTLYSQIASEKREYNSDRTDEAENTSNNFNLSAIYLVYPNTQKDLTFFWGAGPLIGFYNSKFENLSADNVRKYKNLNGGVTGVIGAEWFVRKRISLLVEYQSSFYYFYRKGTEEKGEDANRTTQETIDKGIKFYSNSVKLGLALYF